MAIFSYYKIPKEIFPPTNMDAVVINGTYAGASSDILDKMAVETIEDDLANLSEANKITTVVKNGFFSINIELKKGESSSDLLDKVKDIITKTKVNLPSDMDEPTVKELTQNFPLITVAIYANKSKEQLLQVASKLKSKLSQLNDLSNITIWGDSDKELLISFNESKIEALGLDKSMVINAISKTSSIFPAGIVKDLGRHYYLSSYNGEKDINKIQNMIIRLNGVKFYLKDIADVSYTLGDATTISHFNGKPNISIGINKGETGDSIELVKQIKQILKNEQLKYKDIKFDTYTDTSIWIKNRLNTVVSNILFGLSLLFLALFYFINVRIALVVAIGIPTSFMIGLIGAEIFGYSLNMLSLLGALIALGMLVDEAIVVGENIYRHLEMGKDKVTAAIDGSLEMFPAVLTATATTIFAFLPILMMTGETGKFMQILPVMISILLLSSLFEAFFFLPLHAKELLKYDPNHKEQHNFWDKNKVIYKKILSFLLKGKYITMFLLIFAIIASSAYLLKKTKFEFMPKFDTTQIYITGSVGVGHGIDETNKEVYKVEKLLLDKIKLGNDIDSISSIVGMKLDGKSQPLNEEFYFHIFINLHERAPKNLFDKYINPYLSPKYDSSDMIRDNSAQKISLEIKDILEPYKQKHNLEELNVIVPGAGIVKNDIEISLNGNEKDVKNSIDDIKKALHDIKGVLNIADDTLVGNIEYKFKINQYGQSLGLDEKTLVDQLRPYYFKASYSKMFDDKGIVDIVFQSKNKDIISSLKNFNISINGGTQLVNLYDAVDIIKQNVKSEIFKENGKRITSITASTLGVTSQEVYEKLKSTLEKVKKKVIVEIKGEQQENQKVKKEMAQAFVIALILIFVSLVWMFDSIVKSLMILSTIPLSILGVIIGHNLMGMNLTMPSLIGVVGLAGVIVNDGIIMMDFIKKAKDLEQMKELALLRLRPILLTSLTTVLGLFTLMFFASGQSLILQPMAISLGFGVLWATILNLYYLPMLYRLIYLRKSE
jgi:multidrug efflux pump subunit AcrB